jgi:D-alanyl-D-alanine carboxypeptidase/D-alanyl-D-alanine-endopeptidase (penicillin-binding protein 4)
MRRLPLFASSLILSIGLGHAAAPAPADYLARLAAAGIPRSAATVVVAPLDGGALQWDDNEQQPMNPASTMKLVTTYAALHLLGPAFTFRTEVLADGPLAGDVLRGELYVRGGGDPHLVVEDLWLLVHRLRDYGIRDIRGTWCSTGASSSRCRMIRVSSMARRGGPTTSVPTRCC